MTKKLQSKAKPQSEDICSDNGNDVKEAMLLAALNEKKPAKKDPPDSKRN